MLPMLVAVLATNSPTSQIYTELSKALATNGMVFVGYITGGEDDGPLTNLQVSQALPARGTNTWYFAATSYTVAGLESLPTPELTLSLAWTNSPTATSVGLLWDPSTSTVAGYHIYYGGASHTYTNMVDAGNATNATIVLIRPVLTTNGWDYFWEGAQTLTGPWIQMGQLGHWTNGGTPTPPTFTRIKAVPWKL